jgi:hypothetical protein
MLSAMKLSLEPVPAYFVHVPKTGGISLGTMLEEAYLPWQRVRLDPPRMRRLRLERLGRYRFYHSMHQGRTLLDMTGRTDLACITMLRDPVERTCSQIRYLQRVVRDIPHTFTPEYLAEVAPIVNASLDECLDPAAFHTACDSQIRTLGIREDYAPLFAGSPDAESGRSVLRPYPLPPLMDESDRRALLSNAIEWVDSMAVVGLTERYDHSVLMICDLLGIPAPARMPRLNANPDRSGPVSEYRRTLPPRVIAQIEELTAFDRRLYEHAAERFREQWGRYQSRPHRRSSVACHARQAVLGPLRSVARAARRCGRIVVGR